MKKEYHTLENMIFNTIIYLILTFVFLVCIIPFIYMVAVSFSSSKAIINNEVFLLPVEFTLDSYNTIFAYPDFFKAYGNTLFYTIGGTLIALIMNCLMAYPLSKSMLKGGKFFMKFVVVTMFFSGGLIPTYLVISNYGLTGTPLALLIPFAISPFNLIILVSFFKSLPDEIEEAALIDGLGYFGILLRIVIPLSGPALATVGLYYTVFFWNDWFNSMIYLNASQYPVMMILRNIVNGTMAIGTGNTASETSTLSISIKSAVIITSTLPIIIVYPFLQKFFVKGITLGGVKG